jgi:hypothetical protein
MEFAMNQEKITKLHNKFLIETYTNLDPDRLADLLEFSKIYNAKFIEKSDKKVREIIGDISLDSDEKNQRIDFLVEDVSMMNDIRIIGEELAIIGLYKTIEIAIKKSMKITGKFSKKQLEELHKIEKFIEHFKSINVEVKSIEGFNSFNELRLINNCLKHSGFVSKALMDFNPSLWRKGEKIDNSAETFSRLLYPSVKFVKGLGNKIILTL